MSDWPEYETRKRVRATPIVRRDGGGGVPTALFVAPYGTLKRFDPTELGMADRVGVGDIALEYPDGFKSVNTKANFEATAVRVGADDPRAAPKPDHVWCAVRTDNVHVQTDTLRATVTTSIRAFSSEEAAIDWVGVQPEGEVWVTVPTVLDPAIEGTIP